MTINTKYPRILIVMMTKIKDDDPVNLLIRTQFSEWPKDHLAQIHATGDPPGSGEFCGRCYRLQTCDRFLGGLFQRLRGGVFNMVSPDTVTKQVEVGPVGLISGWAKIIKKCLGDTLVSSGLWEVIFCIRLSKQMETFVRDFNPDMIYCQGYSLGFATLPRLISKRFNIPICFQTTDDWPSYTYKGYLMGWLLRRSARKLVAKAIVRLAFGQKMQKKFIARYGVQFEATYHLDDPRRFIGFQDFAISTTPFRAVYTGSIALRRYEAIIDLVAAIRKLPASVGPIQVEVYCPGIPKDMPSELLIAPEVSFLPLPTHDELPSVLASASVLLLPESFNVAPEFIEYAISTKAHLYMMSGRPILVYGPEYSGTVGYAMDGGWAAVVAERDEESLKEVFCELLNNKAFNDRLRKNAQICAKRNHDIILGRTQFRELITRAVVQVTG
ncbi:MAG: glycosyltransferase family 4 protein [bacterium]